MFRTSSACALAATLVAAAATSQAQAFSNRAQCKKLHGRTVNPYDLEYRIRTSREDERPVQRVIVTPDAADPDPFDAARSRASGGLVLMVGLDNGPLLLTVSRDLEAMMVLADMDTPNADVDFGASEVID